MSGTWGNIIKLSIFGESHGEAIGIQIDGLPSGLDIDMSKIDYEMSRRAPGASPLTTTRAEQDKPEIISGYFNGKTTGTPLCAIIKNGAQHSKDYEKTKNIMRPGHGDYTGYVKYNGFNDYRGGGHFSGRLTAPIVFAGSIIKQILEKEDIFISSQIIAIGNEKASDAKFDIKDMKKLSKMDIPSNNLEFADKARKIIEEARKNLDSVGGIVETNVAGIKAGIGEPFFDSVESILAHLIFSIPGVKGVEFGDGFDISTKYGSEVKDEYYINNEKIELSANHNGGINGGITNGNIINFKTAFKPTPSIGLKQRSLDIEKLKETELEIKGRHDPCIVIRAVPVVEAMAAIGIYELLLEGRAKNERLR